MVTCGIILSAPVPVPFLWTLDLVLGFGTGLGLDNKSHKEKESVPSSVSYPPDKLDLRMFLGDSQDCKNPGAGITLNG